MFVESRIGPEAPSRWTVPISIMVHVLLFIVLLRGRTPIFVAPSSVLGGVHGTSVTHLYWARGSSSLSASNAKDSGAEKSRIVWKKREKIAKPEADLQRPEIASAAPSSTAGSHYGSLSEGPSAGEEIRPALPALTAEPLVSAEDLRGIVEGNVVVEITIDESGRIVNKAVIQSMGAALDGKVLAALENWQFHPATRDGVPIPSKQDVVYHFKPRSG